MFLLKPFVNPYEGNSSASNMSTFPFIVRKKFLNCIGRAVLLKRSDQDVLKRDDVLPIH